MVLTSHCIFSRRAIPATLEYMGEITDQRSLQASAGHEGSSISLKSIISGWSLWDQEKRWRSTSTL